jgi:hypothetical protein
MKNLSPDVLRAIKALVASGEATRDQLIRAKHLKQSEAQFETQIELLVDEVTQVMSPTHPDFEKVWLLAVLSKVARYDSEPEFRSYLEFPNNL